MMQSKKQFIILFLLILFLVSSGTARYIAKNLMYVIALEKSPGIVYHLDILPDGEIVDTYQQWTTASWTQDIAITSNKNYLYVGTRLATIEGFRIDLSNGTLYAINTVSTPGTDLFITPNNEYLIAAGSQALFRIDSTGSLLDTGSRYSVARNTLGLNPRGNPLIVDYEYNLLMYHLDYNSATLTLSTTAYFGGGITPWKIAFTPDGSLGLMNGYLLGTYDVMGLHIDTTESVSSTGQIWNFGFAAPDVAVTPDGKFGFVTVDGSIVTLKIDMEHGIITDTGKRFSPYFNFSPIYIRIAEDGTLAVINSRAIEDEVTTAFIGPDGDLTWTGYTFPFGTTYLGTGDAIMDFELVPIYATGINSPQWQLYK